MFLTRSEYDRGVNTFSPEGRLFQVEYAIEAIKLGSTAIGIQTSEGVCLAVEKRITSPLMEPSSIEKIVEIDAHIGCAMSGLIADAKTLIDKARVETQNHWFTYNETMTVESVTQAVSNLALQFGEEDADPGAMSRPFGVALLFGGVDEKGPQLFHMDPSGTFVQCDARAIGSASEGAQSSLQEVYHKSMTLKEAIKSSLIILKQVMEEKLNATNIEQGSYCSSQPESLWKRGPRLRASNAPPILMAEVTPAIVRGIALKPFFPLGQVFSWHLYPSLLQDAPSAKRQI
ncbi:proteasome subunit alpha type-5 isoform X1 [Alexandromys fortis]|uniref:proteasome subunit alpha type-5 isoform X1 n=1 Tax=Alexandromys fortis TaxID=100897 RepID=UPI0021530294|nr:proteasome subunit alpha type-5 isoform X1 [Microtus fortis]